VQSDRELLLPPDYRNILLAAAVQTNNNNSEHNSVHIGSMHGHPVDPHNNPVLRRLQPSNLQLRH
jgi:hypothetical protein